MIRIPRLGLTAFALLVLTSAASVSNAQQYPQSTYQEMRWRTIGAIAVAPSDPNIVYAASGEGLQRPENK